MSDEKPVAPQLIRQHLVNCERRWEQQEARTRTLEESMTEHRMRLENGTMAFQGLREDHSTMASTFAEKVADLTPKPPSVSKVVSIVLAVIGLGAGSLWGLSSMLNDRPTTKQIDKIMDGHQKNGHKETREELRELRDVQIEQKTALEHIGQKVDKQDAKLDTLIQQTKAPDDPPPRRNGNRNR
jgi:uncharacterized protein HemX